jgi:hypothetical protein
MKRLLCSSCRRRRVYTFNMIMHGSTSVLCAKVLAQAKAGDAISKYEDSRVIV